MKKYNIKVNGVAYEVEVEEVGGNISSQTASTVQASTPKAPTPAPAPMNAPAVAASNSSAGSNSVKAPMPGTIVKINSKAGDTVKKGDVILVLEAMKMENDITAPIDCTISSVNVQQGGQVATGDILVTYN